MHTLAELLAQRRMPDDDALEDWQRLAALFTGVAHRARIAVITGLYNDQPIPEIVDDVDITRGALQSHLERLIDADLVYRTGDAAAPYRLTPLGVFFAELLEEHQNVLLDAIEELDAVEADARDEFADVPMSDEQVETEVQRRKWELARQDLAELLDVPEE